MERYQTADRLKDETEGGISIEAEEDHFMKVRSLSINFEDQLKSVKEEYQSLIDQVIRINYLVEMNLIFLRYPKNRHLTKLIIVMVKLK